MPSVRQLRARRPSPVPKLKLRLTTKSPTFSEMRRPLLQAGASAESINSLKKLFDAEDAVRFGSLASCLSGSEVPLKNSSSNSKLNCALTVPGNRRRLRTAGPARLPIRVIEY